MRETRAVTQPSDGNITVKKCSTSSGDATLSAGEGTSSAAVITGMTTSPGVIRNTSSTCPASCEQRSMEERNAAFHQIQEVASQLICNPLRIMVSQNRRRYRQDGFDLDLTYITDRIIAMGYPADTKEALYRNSMSHIVRFLEKNHPGHYKVFNLRGQYVYDTSKFHNRVVSFEMTDHHPPRLELMAPFCREVHDYLEADPKNVVAVHCKAGKGRTGVMICAYLVYINFYLSPRQNMDYYSIVRTRNNKVCLNLVNNITEIWYFYLGTVAKGALNVRVANGDVDVFLGEDMWISNEEWTAEEELWSGNVVANGDDSYDPCNPQPGRDCISRRAWGWRVPADRRVFLEGDVRVDLFSKQKLLGFNQDRKKLGHVWFNTMFACAGFCGGVYRHGDEAHPYPEGATTIAERRSTPLRPKTGSASLPSSPPGTPKTRTSGSVSGATRAAARAPSFDARKSGSTSASTSARTPRFQINHVVKKSDAASRNSEPHIDRNTEEHTSGRRPDRKIAKDKERPVIWDDDMELMRPPGLDRHCPSETLASLYGQERLAPRWRIEDMLRDAHRNNLIEDVYNQRRLSVPQEGQPVEPATESRPDAGGPALIRRAPDEHVQVFSVLEIDRAFKNKNIGEGFKLIIVTRCVPADNVANQRLAESFLRVTHQKQAAKDNIKQEKVNARQRKIQGVGSGVCLGVSDPSGDAQMTGGDATLTDDAFRNDPRLADPFMSRFFHRQREDSVSVYPNGSYSSNSTGPSGQSDELQTSATRLAASSTVRSYHPDDSNWAHSASSRSSSSVITSDRAVSFPENVIMLQKCSVGFHVAVRKVIPLALQSDGSAAVTGASSLSTTQLPPS
uniref:Phosphatase tensin-type domain-containing protein n=1 Tax=Heterorhabditis bacteriophora TaxID=37862 RepID=A0A1I7XRN8_HETBA